MSETLLPNHYSEPETYRVRFDELRHHEESIIDDIIASQALLDKRLIKEDNQFISTSVAIHDPTRPVDIAGAYWEMEVKHAIDDTELGKRQVILHQYLKDSSGLIELSRHGYSFHDVTEPLERRGFLLGGQKVRGNADAHEERELYLDLVTVSEALAASSEVPRAA